MARGVSAGSVRFDVVASNAKFNKALRQSLTRLQKFQQSAGRIARKFRISWKAVAAAITGVGIAAGAAIKKMTDYSSSVVETARVVGLTTKELENMRKLLEGDGIGVKKADRALKDFNVRVGFAKRGIGQYTRAFEELGIELRNADGSFKSNNKLLTEVADKLKTNEDHARSASLAYELFGTAGRELLPILQKHGKALDEAAKHAGRYNTLTAEQHQANKQLGQSLLDLKNNSLDLVYRVLAKYSPVLIDIINKFNDWIFGIKESKSGFDELVESVEKTVKSMALLMGIVTLASAGQKVGGMVGATIGAGIGGPAGAFPGFLVGSGVGMLAGGGLGAMGAEGVINWLYGIIDSTAKTPSELQLEELLGNKDYANLKSIEGHGMTDAQNKRLVDYYKLENEIRARIKEERALLDKQIAERKAKRAARNKSLGGTTAAGNEEEAVAAAITLTDFLDNNKARRTRGGFAGYSAPGQPSAAEQAAGLFSAAGFGSVGGMLADDWSQIGQALGAGDARSKYWTRGGGLQVPISYPSTRFHSWAGLGLESRRAFMDSMGANRPVGTFSHPDLRDYQKSRRTRGQFYDRWGAVGGASSGGGVDTTLLATEIMPGMMEWAAKLLTRRLNAQTNTSGAMDGGAWMKKQVDDMQVTIMPGMMEWAAKTLETRLKDMPVSSEIGGQAYARQLLESRLQSGVTGGRIYGSAAINRMKHHDDFQLKDQMEGLLPLANELRGAFSNFTHSLIADFKNAGEAAKQLARDILKIGTQRMIVNPIANALFGAADGSDGGGIFGSMASAFVGAFSDGGHARRGLALVGERGPELVDFQRPGMVYSNEQLSAAMSGGRGGITIQYNISSTDGPGVRAALAAATPGIVETARATVMEDSTRIGGFQQAVQGGR